MSEAAVNPPEICKSCRIFVEQIQRDIRKKEGFYMKESAVLNQKVELTNIQLQEADERANDFKSMHETMIGALRPETPEKGLFKKELDFATQLHDKEKEEIQKNYELIKEIYDKQILELRDRNEDLENMVKEVSYHKDEIEKEYEQASEQYRREKDQMLEEINQLNEAREEYQVN